MLLDTARGGETIAPAASAMVRTISARRRIIDSGIP